MAAMKQAVCSEKDMLHFKLTPTLFLRIGVGSVQFMIVPPEIHHNLWSLTDRIAMEVCNVFRFCRGARIAQEKKGEFP
eukprot:4956786-Amphidinium_carterae.1